MKQITIGDIEERRIALGVRAQSLARRAGVAASTYSRLRDGKTQPMARTLQQLSDALDAFECARNK